MKALVLGGSQFVGLHTVRELVARGYDVTVLNRGKTKTQLPPGVERLVADRADGESMRAALQGKDWDAAFDVSGFLMAAMGGSMSALVDLLDGHVGAYVYTSSIMVYAPSGVFPWRESFARVDDEPNTYGGFKKMAEETLLARYSETGFPVTVVRPAAIYGPDNNIYDMEMAYYLRLLRGLPVIVPHDGLVTASYGHVDDLCRAMVDMGK
jgi:nucleoside-diphosphate-sugar epimerase